MANCQHDAQDVRRCVLSVEPSIFLGGDECHAVALYRLGVPRDLEARPNPIAVCSLSCGVVLIRRRS